MALDPLTAGFEAAAAACNLAAEFLKGMNEQERRDFYAECKANREGLKQFGAFIGRMFDPATWPKLGKD